jgi:integrase
MLPTTAPPVTTPSPGAASPVEPDIPLRQLGRAIASACTSAGLLPATTRAYIYWARRYVMFHGNAHPAALPPAAVAAFIRNLVEHHRIAASTQNLVLHAVETLYRDVLRRPMPTLALRSLRAKPVQSLPRILDQTAIPALLNELSGPARLVALLQYGCGLRLREALQLRIADVDLEQLTITLPARGKSPARVLHLPASLLSSIRQQMALRRQALHRDLARPGTTLPSDALASWPALCLFCTSRGTARSAHPPGHRPPPGPPGILRDYRLASQAAGIVPPIGAQSLRQAFATHLIEQQVDLRQVQERLGLADVASVAVYLQLSRRGPGGVTSPLDTLPEAMP